MNFRRVSRYVLLLLSVGAFGLAAFIVGLVWLRNRPVELPAPGGPYPVGRVEYDWTDSARPDPLAADPSQPRKLNVWIWYPGEAGASGAGPAPYLPSAWVTERERDEGFGILLKQNLDRVQGHSTEQLPLSGVQGSYPVLIMQPGLGPILPDYTTLAELLASYGYIVVGSTPTESSVVVVFNDGQTVYRTPQGNLPDSASPEEAGEILDKLIQVWVGDDGFLVDQIERLNAADPEGRFTGRINLGKVGVFGHSFGGASAEEFCAHNARCKAGADLDGYLYGDVAQVGLQQPFLFLWSEPANKTDPNWQRAMQEANAALQSQPEGRQITIPGTRHFNFTDFAVEYAPIYHLVGALGPIDGEQGLQTIATDVREFFDGALLNP